MLAGDLRTMPLPDLLQWIDATRGRALVEVTTPDGREAWLLADQRVVVAASAPAARGRLATDGRPGAPGPGLIALSTELLLDLFLGAEGKFVLRERAPTPEAAVAIEMPVQFLVMEGLRLLDEWPRIQASYPSDDARLGATDDEPTGLDAIDAAIHTLALEAPPLGEARLVLGLSRACLLRRVDRLRARGLVDVEGTPHGPDVERSIVAQASLLLGAEQFAEAAHVFRTLLASNPSDAQVARLLAEAERLHTEACYRRLSPTDVISMVEGGDRGRLSGVDVAVLDCLSRPRSVSVLVLVSPLRELETLTALERLAKKGAVSIEGAE